MKYLLDTCLVSELIRPRPDENVMRWVADHQESDFFLSALTIGEIQKGIGKLDEGEKKAQLTAWLAKLGERFGQRVLAVDHDIASAWGLLAAKLEKQGQKKSVVDCLLAATALSESLVIATRNQKDFDGLGIDVQNPWILTV